MTTEEFLLLHLQNVRVIIRLSGVVFLAISVKETDAVKFLLFNLKYYLSFS